MQYKDYNIKSLDFAEALPVLDIIDKEVCLLKNGDLAILAQIHLPEIYTIGSGDYDIINKSWINAIKFLPPNICIHKQDIYSKQNTANTQEYKNYNETSLLSKANKNYFANRTYLKHNSYLYITQSSNETKETYNFRFKNLYPNTKELLKKVQTFKQNTKAFISTLEGSKLIKLDPLQEDEILNTKGNGLYKNWLHLNFSGSPIYERLVAHGDKLWVGDRECNIFAINSLELLPEVFKPAVKDTSLNLYTSMCSKLGNLLNCDHITNVLINTQDRDKLVKKLKRRIKRYDSFLPFSIYNQLGKRDTEEYINELQENGRIAVTAHASIMLFTNSQEEYSHNKALLQKAISEAGFEGIEQSKYNTMLYWSSMPGNGASLPESETYHLFLDQASCMLINDTSYKDTKGPFAMPLIDRIEGKRVMVDLSDEFYLNDQIPNRNKFILGPSGSGKSFFTNHMVRHYYEGGAHTLLVDIGDSYETQCKIISEQTQGKDGIYFTYKDDNPIKLNPFISAKKYYSEEKKQSLKAMIIALWKKEGEEISKFEDTILGMMISSYIKHIKNNDSIRPSFNSFFEYTKDIFSQELETIDTGETTFDLRNFLSVLLPYYKGGDYDYLLNSQEDIDLLNERLIVFELRAIEKNSIILPIITLMIIDVFTTKLLKLGGQRAVIIIEEAWKAIARSTMAQYIKDLYRTVRKYEGEAIIVTQELDDIISSETIKETIINNSACKILLETQYKNNFDKAQKFLSLNDSEKEQILSINQSPIKGLNPYREVWIGLGTIKSAVYGIEVSKEEFYSYNSRKDTKLKIKSQTKQCNNSIKAAIKELALTN